MCFTKIHKSTSDLISTNKGNCFQKTKVTETGLSDFHKLIGTFLSSHFSRLNSKTIYYRNYKKINKQNFLKDVKNTNFYFNSDNSIDIYELITDLFSKIANKHVPLKTKFVRGNQGPLINKELRKAIYDRSRLKNRFCKTPTEENKKQKNKCASVQKKVLEIISTKLHMKT